MFLVNLLENAALHCFVGCFLHLQCLSFNFKYKIEGATEKIKNHPRFLYRIDLPIHDKKTTLKSGETLPLSGKMYNCIDATLAAKYAESWPNTTSDWAG